MIGHNGLIAVQLVDRVFNKGRGLVIIQNQLMAAEHALVVRMNELIVKFKTVLYMVNFQTGVLGQYAPNHAAEDWPLDTETVIILCQSLGD